MSNHIEHCNMFRDVFVQAVGTNHSQIILTNEDVNFINGINNIYYLKIKDIDPILSIEAVSERIGGQLFDLVNKFELKTITICNQTSNLLNAFIINGFILKSWRFDKYKKPTFTIENFKFLSQDPQEDQKTLEQLLLTTTSVLWARYLCNLPSNEKNPETLKDMIIKELEGLNLQIDILDQNQMKAKNMNLLLSVSLGSPIPPYTLIIKSQKSKPLHKEKLCIIGKGVTFDTGGVSLKPSDNMHDMITDMSGAMAVVAACRSLAHTDLDFCGIIGLVENAIDGNAQKPGDIWQSMNGKTVQVLNTDAEGRLVLGDLVCLANHLGYNNVLSIATLTGACQVALGNYFAALCTQNKELENLIIKAGNQSGEQCWPLPLHNCYRKNIEGLVTDLINIGNISGAGTIIGAKFVEELSLPNTKFAHLDIANMTSRINHLSSEKYNAYGVKHLIDIIKLFNQESL